MSSCVDNSDDDGTFRAQVVECDDGFKFLKKHKLPFPLMCQNKGFEGLAFVREIGDDWWRNPKTGDHLRELWREGTKPSSEDIAARMGFEPLDTGPLIAELGGS